MTKRWTTTCFAFALGVFSATSALSQDTPRVVAVNQALKYFGDRLLGDGADVIFPVPAGVDPSFWRPSIADISMVQSADLILLNGANFATWLDRVSLPRSRLVNTSSGFKDQYIVTESITHDHGEGGEHSHEGLASYVWLDPALAIAQAEAVASAIIKRDLAEATDVEARLAELKTDLMALDSATQDALSAADGITFIATHPRYQYFARRYGLSVTSLEWEAGAMPSDDQLAELARLTDELSAQVIIWEAEPPQQAIDAANELGLKSVVFEPFAGVSSRMSLVETMKVAVSEISDALAATSN